MPVKRRSSKRRTAYPPAIEALIAGETPEPTEDAADALVGLAYLGEAPQEPDLCRRAADVLRVWREERRDF